MIHKNHKGLFYEDSAIEIFFGNRHFTLAELTQLRPLGAHTVKQTHSDIFHIINQDEPRTPPPEGDALGTSLRQQYLAIKTADCLPVMLHDPIQKKIAAIHAGWKGIAIGIVPKVIGTYFLNSTNMRIYIGPHITKSSFEIRNDVLSQLKASLPLPQREQVEVEIRGDKFHVDLVDIVTTQVKSQFPRLELDVMTSAIDTKSNDDFNSHRREPTNSGRNISYIRLK